MCTLYFTSVHRKHRVLTHKTGDNIQKVLKQIKDNLRKTNLENASEPWIKFINLKQEPGESTKEYMNKFENINMEMKNTGMKLPQIMLTT